MQCNYVVECHAFLLALRPPHSAHALYVRLSCHASAMVIYNTVHFKQRRISWSKGRGIEGVGAERSRCRKDDGAMSFITSKTSQCHGWFVLPRLHRRRICRIPPYYPCWRQARKRFPSHTSLVRDTRSCSINSDWRHPSDILRAGAKPITSEESSRIAICRPTLQQLKLSIFLRTHPYITHAKHTLKHVQTCSDTLLQVCKYLTYARL